MSLTARVGVRVGGLDLDAALDVPTGETVVLLGPNGAGKSTLVRALAGLLAVAEGRVVLDGDVLEDTAAGVRVPPEQRPTGVVFQDGLLFPHLSLLDNVAFGLRSRGMSRQDAHRAATAWLDRVSLAGRAHERPDGLSGGEAQRVALARALVTEPRLLLLDEPFSALDAEARAALRRDLRHHLASYAGTRLLVTHDPVEALTLADRLVVLEAGRVTQAGTPEEISRRPLSRWVAELVGVNLFRGRAHGATVTLPNGGAIVSADSCADGDVCAVVHPHAVALHLRAPEGSPRNAWQGTVEEIDPALDRVRVRVAAAVPVVAEITPGALADLGLAEGSPVWATVKATEVDVYPA